jgi:hypothetical protein
LSSICHSCPLSPYSLLCPIFIWRASQWSHIEHSLPLAMLLFQSFFFFLIIYFYYCCAGVHCDIYKSSYNIS